MAETETRKQGPRRSETSQAAILSATRAELQEHGWRRFSADGVARRAKASKQTIYRWWPSIGVMCLEAALEQLPEPPRDGRDPVERISAILRPLETTARSASGQAALRGAMLAAADDPEAGERWRAWLHEAIRGPLRMILAELSARKVIRHDWNLDAALDILLGPLWHRLLIMHAPVPDAYGRRQAEQLITYFAPD